MHAITADEVMAEYGNPAQGAGGQTAVAGARGAVAEHVERMGELVDRCKSEGRKMSAAEQRAFDSHESQARQLAVLQASYGHRAELAAASRASTTSGTGTNGAGAARFYTGGNNTYRRGDAHGPSWVKDMIAVSLRGDRDAGDRLARNTNEVALEHRALSTSDGAGGDFVPPAYLVDQYVALARAGRVTANLCDNQPMPAGTDSINLPKILTGTAVAEQATQNTAIQNTDATTGLVTAAVTTLAGQQVVAVQAVEQSPISLDEVLLKDLLADLASKVDLFVLNNNAAGKRGILNAAGTNSVAFTTASPTVPLLYAKLADARQRIENARYLPPDGIVMAPRRWAWFLAAADTAGRPMITPNASGPYNSVGTTNGTTNADGSVGSIMGLNVWVDPLMAQNLGAGTNEDRIIVGRFSDAVLYESLPKAEAFREPLSGQLSILLRTYEYAAFTAERLPAAFSIISGTGLVTPTW